MPISKINDDGTANIYNSKTGEVMNNVPFESLANISPKLVGAYIEMQNVKPAERLADVEATAKLKAIESGKTKPGQDAKDAAKADSAENILKTLEDLYFREGQVTGLAYAKPGLGGRLSGTAKELERKYAPTKETEQLNTYKRILESKRSLLARAAGDVGNLALQEQILAGRGLPDETATPEEAYALFRESRNALGLKPREKIQKLEEKYSKKATTKQPTQPPSPQITAQPRQGGIQNTTLGELGKMIPGLIGQGVQAGVKALPGAGQTTNILQNPAFQGIFKTVNPNTAAVVGKTTQGQLPTGQEALGAGRENVLGALGLIPGIGAARVAPKLGQAVNIGGSAVKARRAAGAALEAKNIRLGNSNLQKIAQDMIASKVPTYKEAPLIQKLAKGEQIKANEGIDLLVRAGKKTFTKGGDYRSNRVADFYELLRSGLRDEFSAKGPEVIKQTSNIARGMKVTKAAKKAAWPLAFLGVGELVRRGLSARDQNP